MQLAALLREGRAFGCEMLALRVLAAADTRPATAVLLLTAPGPLLTP